MRVAIAGAGNVGRSIAGELLGNGHEEAAYDASPVGPPFRAPRRV